MCTVLVTSMAGLQASHIADFIEPLMLKAISIDRSLTTGCKALQLALQLEPYNWLENRF